jgi:hypothetical protein
MGILSGIPFHSNIKWTYNKHKLMTGWNRIWSFCCHMRDMVRLKFLIFYHQVCTFLLFTWTDGSQPTKICIGVILSFYVYIFLRWIANYINLELPSRSFPVNIQACLKLWGLHGNIIRDLINTNWWRAETGFGHSVVTCHGHGST